MNLYPNRYKLYLRRYYFPDYFDRLGRGFAPVPNSTFRRALFERSELRSHVIWCRGGVYPKGRERANMVWGPFAETKGPRRAGSKPRNCMLLLGASSYLKDWRDLGALKAELLDLTIMERNKHAKAVVTDIEKQRRQREEGK